MNESEAQRKRRKKEKQGEEKLQNARKSHSEREFRVCQVGKVTERHIRLKSESWD